MKKRHYITLFLIFILVGTTNTIFAQSDSLQIKEVETVKKDSLRFTMGKVVLNPSLWTQPYRYETKGLKTLSIRITVERSSPKIQEVDYNLFSLLVASKGTRIRSTGVFYYKSANKKKYLRTQGLNLNYNEFQNYTFDGFENFEEKTFKPNFLGKQKKNQSPSIKQLKKLTLKKRSLTYYIDFPVDSKFTQGTLYYKGKSIGIVRVEN